MSLRHSRVGSWRRSTFTLALAGLVGCSGIGESSVATNSNSTANSNGSTMEDQAKPAVGGEINSRLVSANSEFGFKLLRELTRQGAGKNVFISPASVALCLAMTYNGAEGETKQAMARALGAQGMSLDELNRGYAALKAALENPDPKVQLQIANSLWARQGINFRQGFVARNRDNYGAEVTELNFADPSAPSVINSWVREKTKDKIDKIVDEIDPQAVLFLINAIYFKGAWTVEFDKAKTREDVFTTASGLQKRHAMMNQSGKYDYLEGQGFQAVSLPYGNRRVSMYVFLPAKGASLDQFSGALTAAKWSEWMDRFERTEGVLVLPRFKVEYEATLNDALKSMGMGVAFDPDRANFGAMFETPESAYISKVRHKTFAEVNEEGTEAAAVTSTEVVVTSMPSQRKTFRMVVDRPFVFAIRDNETGSLLFLGSISDPS